MTPLNITFLCFPEGITLSTPTLFTNDMGILTIVDVSLAIVLVVLAAAYMKRRRELAQLQRESPPSFLDMLETFLKILERVERKVSEVRLREAVLTEFPKILDVAVKIDGTNIEASLTAYEAISHGLTKIPEDAKDVLMTLYQIYEPVRFGNALPSPEGGLRFLEALKRLDEMLIKSGAINV